MERHFDQELDELKQAISRMGFFVEEAIVNSVQSLKELDRKKARDVIENDRKVDELELDIDERCVDLFALRQPMAVDLRYVVTAGKITTDLERMADLAVDIAERVEELADYPLLKPLVDIPKLAILAQGMVRDSLSSFLQSNSEMAKEVIFRDEEVDRLRDLVQSELVNDYMLKDSTTVPRAVPLLLVARFLERICDHATNIAEDVIYMVTAKVVKHHPENLENDLRA